MAERSQDRPSIEEQAARFRAALRGKPSPLEEAPTATPAQVPAPEEPPADEVQEPSPVQEPPSLEAEEQATSGAEEQATVAAQEQATSGAEEQAAVAAQEEAPLSIEERAARLRQAAGRPPSVQEEQPSPVADEPPSPERLNQARRAYGSYYRWLKMSRLAMALFLMLAVAIGFWLIPWFPGGLDPADYTSAVSFTIYLLCAVALSGVLALVLRERAWRKRESLLAWSAVYDEATGLHHRQYLYDRLSLECERADRTDGVFSIIILHMRLGSQRQGALPTASNTALQKIAELINGLTHPGDMVAMLSGGELAVLAMGVDRTTRHPLVERLRNAVAAELPNFLSNSAIVGVAGGVATYGVDGSDPEELIKSARTSTALGSAVQTRSA